MRNRKLVLSALSVVAVAAVVLAGGLMASNMGFKLNMPLYGAGQAVPPSGVSASGTNFIGLPYNQQVGIVTARDLWNDLGANPDILISRHIKATDAFNFYGTSTDLPPNGWNLAAGEAYVVKLGNVSQNYIVVGSHNPGLAIQLVGAGPGSGTNFYSHPYHGTAATARDLWNELGANPDILISRHIKQSDAFNFYGTSTDIPPNGWNMQPGEGLIVKVAVNQSFTPAHY
jgi:hypothetical protein